jgi:hypothetical protein
VQICWITIETTNQYLKEWFCSSYGWSVCLTRPETDTMEGLLSNLERNAEVIVGFSAMAQFSGSSNAPERANR